MWRGRPSPRTEVGCCQSCPIQALIAGRTILWRGLRWDIWSTRRIPKAGRRGECVSQHRLRQLCCGLVTGRRLRRPRYRGEESPLLALAELREGFLGAPVNGERQFSPAAVSCETHSGTNALQIYEFKVRSEQPDKNLESQIRRHNGPHHVEPPDKAHQPGV
jgi:hypothetical protein